MRSLIIFFFLLPSVCFAQIINTINCSDPCEGVSYPDEPVTGEFDCTVSNIRVDSVFSFVCVGGLKEPSDTTTTSSVIFQGCLDAPDLVASSDSDITSGTSIGWNPNYYSSDCPLYGDFKYCYDYDFSDFDNLFIVNLSSTKGSFWGEYSVYQYNRFATINYIRPYQVGGGGYVTGWNNITPKKQTTVCIERVGSTITYSEDGNVFYTGTAFYMGSVYVNYTPYFHPTNTWSTGEHNLTNSEICETNGGVSSRNGRFTGEEIFLDPLQQFETLPELWGYVTGQTTWRELQVEMKRLGIKLSKNDVKDILEKYELEEVPELGINLENKIIKSLKKPNAISTISGKFSEYELIVFAVNRGVLDKVSDWDGKKKKDLIIKLLAWAQKNKLISFEHYKREVER